MRVRSTTAALRKEKKVGSMTGAVPGVLSAMWLAASGMAAATAVSLPAVAADAQATYEINLPAQAVAESLRAIGQLTSTNILFDPATVAQRMAPEVKGTLTVNSAINLVIAGMGLEATRSANAILIRKAGEKTTARGDRGEPGIRLAQAEAPGAEAQSNSFALEEIVVTAQKRQERLIDVPISIVALNADDLQKRRITTIDDLQAAVPGLSIVGSGELQRRIMLRGVSNTFGSGGLIGMYLDEVPVSPSGAAAERDLRTYDLERVEVLRGPQGTLYGAGSIGGTIRFITAKPRLDGFAAKTDLATALTEDGDMSRRVEGMVNLPLIESTLGLRIAGTYDHQGGWMDQPALGEEDINDRTTAHVRAKALWQLSEQFSVDAMAVVHRTDGSPGSQGEDANGNFTQAFNLATTPSVDDDYDIYNLTLAYDFSAARLLSTTSYLDTSKEARDVPSFLQLFAPPAPRRSFVYFLRGEYSDIFTEEVRLTSQGDGPWQWTVGGFYRRARDESSFVFSTDGASRFYQVASGESKATALFADASYQLTQKVKVGAGVRYFEEDKETQDALAANAPPAALGPLRSAEFDSVDPRIYLQYKWNEDASTYISVAEGFRSGGLNSGSTSPPYDPETARTYELGSKLSLYGGRLAADAAIFYSDYENYQISGLVPTPPTNERLNRLSNAGDATIKGVEASLSWRPTAHWSFGLNASYLDTEFTSIAALNSPYLVGDNLDLIPEFTYSVSAQREWDLGARPGFVRLDYSQQDRVTYRHRNLFNATPWYFGESDIINLLNLNVGLQWNRHLSLSVFAENLLNDRGHTTPFAVTDNIANRARPRTVGVQFSINFE